MAIFKNEADFQTNMLAHIKKRWWFGFKIADSDCRLKPADCVVTFWDETYWIELKYRSATRQPNILHHQENSCRRVWKAGGKYFFLEYNARTHRAYVIRWFIPKESNIHPDSVLRLLGLDDFLI